jgi:hypothetical protein
MTCNKGSPGLSAADFQRHFPERRPCQYSLCRVHVTMSLVRPERSPSLTPQPLNCWLPCIPVHMPTSYRGSRASQDTISRCRAVKATCSAICTVVQPELLVRAYKMSRAWEACAALAYYLSRHLLFTNNSDVPFANSTRLLVGRQ